MGSETYPIRACGILYVHPGSGIFSKWKKRWFDLCDGRLTYRQEVSDKKLDKVIDLRDVTEIKQVQGVPPGAKTKYAGCGLTLVELDKEFRLMAETMEEKARWFRKLQEAKRRADVGPPPVVPKPEETVLPNGAPLLVPHPGWELESAVNTGNSEYYAPAVDHPETEMAWYRSHFYNAEHAIYTGKDETAGLVTVVVKRETGLNPGETLIRGILFTRTGPLRYVLEAKPFKTYLIDMLTFVKAVEPSIVPAAKKFLMVNGERRRQELIELEENMFARRYKFGLVYARDGQTTEEQMLANDYDPVRDVEYGRFLDLIGTRIKLKGWDGYKAGLDVVAGQTGEDSVFTAVSGYDVMFHVSTMLPHEPSGQEVQRKRQIGNDVVAIIFMNGTTPYNPQTIECQFIHFYAVVQPEGTPGKYRVQFARQSAVRPVAPLFPAEVWEGNANFVDMLLTKLINAEKSALVSAPSFVNKFRRTNETYLRSLYDISHSEPCGKDGIMPAAVAPPPLPTHPVGGPRAAIPDTVPGKVFEAKPFIENFPADTRCMDLWLSHESCADPKWVYATMAGVFVGADEEEDMQVSHAKLVDITVLSSIGVALGRRAPKGEILVIYLNSIGEWHHHVLKTTKGARTFAVDERGVTAHLAVAVKKQIILYRWEDCCFHKFMKFDAPSVPRVLKFLNGQLSYASTSESVMVELESGLVTRLYSGAKANPTDILLLDNGCIMIAYDRTSFVLDWRGKRLQNFEFEWSIQPKKLVSSGLYVLAVSDRYIECRYLVNGNLAQMVHLPCPVRAMTVKGGTLYVASGSLPVHVMSIEPVLLHHPLIGPRKQRVQHKVITKKCVNLGVSLVDVTSICASAAGGRRGTMFELSQNAVPDAHASDDGDGEVDVHGDGESVIGDEDFSAVVDPNALLSPPSTPRSRAGSTDSRSGKPPAPGRRLHMLRTVSDVQTHLGVAEASSEGDDGMGHTSEVETVQISPSASVISCDGGLSLVAGDPPSRDTASPAPPSEHRRADFLGPDALLPVITLPDAPDAVSLRSTSPLPPETGQRVKEPTPASESSGSLAAAAAAPAPAATSGAPSPAPAPAPPVATASAPAEETSAQQDRSSSPATSPGKGNNAQAKPAGDAQDNGKAGRDGSSAPDKTTGKAGRDAAAGDGRGSPKTPKSQPPRADGVGSAASSGSPPTKNDTGKTGDAASRSGAAEGSVSGSKVESTGTGVDGEQGPAPPPVDGNQAEESVHDDHDHEGRLYPAPLVRPAPHVRHFNGPGPASSLSLAIAADDTLGAVATPVTPKKSQTSSPRAVEDPELATTPPRAATLSPPASQPTAASPSPHEVALLRALEDLSAPASPRSDGSVSPRGALPLGLEMAAAHRAALPRLNTNRNRDISPAAKSSYANLMGLLNSPLLVADPNSPVG